MLHIGRLRIAGKWVPLCACLTRVSAFSTETPAEVERATYVRQRRIRICMGLPLQLGEQEHWEQIRLGTFLRIDIAEQRQSNVGSLNFHIDIN